jgi:hypothetical protein
MIAFLGIPALAWFILFFGAGCLAFGTFIGLCIHGAEEPEFEVPEFCEEPAPADLDDWLAESEAPFDFKLWERPRSEARLDRGVAS